MRRSTRPLLAVLAAASLAGVFPVSAQDAPAPAGRFQLAPGSGSSFIRLDTRTGAVSHCHQDVSGVWRCDPIMDSGLAQQLGALSSRVDQLSGEFDRLSLRVELLGWPSQFTFGRPRTRHQIPAERSGFARSAIDRLLEMIREIKRGVESELIAARCLTLPKPTGTPPSR